MIVDSKKQPLKVKLIDFGLARPVSAVEPGVCVQTTWYRAPEVMLHLPFDEAIDMWSLGLVAAELATGSPLYPGDTDYDVLRFILETQGQPADDVLDRGMGTEYYFREQRHGQQRWMFKSPEQFAYETGVYANETRCQRLKSLDDLEHLMMDSDHQTEQRLLVDLIKRMLELDPEQRIKPLEVLQHPFFAQSPPQRAHICVQMSEEEPPTLSPQCSGFRRRTASLAAGLEDNNGEVDVQPNDNADNDGWLRRLILRKAVPQTRTRVRKSASPWVKRILPVDLRVHSVKANMLFCFAFMCFYNG
ncbi:homeodomain-interacting protein kinase 1-like [Dicentrarchus labrax]|uniref:homeodomain-interacting protein kinase 1-like n=1 Tax=Dicentrarchus labrax TaxID=13489 RepID=UPI0021F595A3|nr:homeodomain-interacting protein kinase 1-like [Dicentrarchus labrax]